MSAAELTAQTPLPAALLRGVTEQGGLGLVLPGMLHIRTELTPLAAAGLVMIMIGAVVVTVQTMGLGSGCTAVCNRRASVVCGVRALANETAGRAAGNRTSTEGALLTRGRSPDVPVSKAL
jgi:hypothetical protein